MAIVEFNIPSRVVFGAGSISELGGIVAKYGGRALIITDGKSFEQTGIINKIREDIQNSFVNVMTYSDVTSDSTSDTSDIAANIARFSKADVIVALGGFRVQNIAKGAAIVVTNSGEASDYVNGQPIYHKPMPLISIPTIYGSLAEISSRLCLYDKYDGINKQCASNKVYATDCIMDSDMYKTIPIKYMISSAVSVFALSFDIYMSNSVTTISDALISRAMRMAMRDLKKLVSGTYSDSCENLISANMLCAVASCHSYLGAVRALSIAMNSVFSINMSMFSAIILPHIMEYYIPVVPDKYIYLGRFMGEIDEDLSPLEVASKITQYMKTYLQNINLPTNLSSLNVDSKYFKDVAKMAISFPGMDQLPRPMTEDVIINILEQAY